MKKTIIFLTLFVFSFSLNLNAYEEKPVHIRTTAPYQEFLKATFSIEGKNNQNNYYPRDQAFISDMKMYLMQLRLRHVVQSKNKIQESDEIWGDLGKRLFIRMHIDNDKVSGVPNHKEICLLNNNRYEGLYFFHENPSDRCRNISSVF